MRNRIVRQAGSPGGMGLVAAGVCVLILCLGFCSCEKRDPRETARIGLRNTTRTAAFQLAIFRREEGCYPHAKAGLKFVLSEDGFAPIKNPDGSFTLALNNFGPHIVESADCCYLNPGPGSLSDPTAKIVLAVLVEKELGETSVIDSACTCYLLRPVAGRDPKGLLGKPVAELEGSGSIAETYPMGPISSDAPPAPWRATCDKPEHIPDW